MMPIRHMVVRAAPEVNILGNTIITAAARIQMP